MLHLDGDAWTSQLEWPPWLRAMGVPDLVPAGTLHFSQYDQLVQAALAGQGIALGRSPIIDAFLDDGRLVAPLGRGLESARAYYLLTTPASAARADVAAFTGWLREEAQSLRPA
jgi:DNA-binding transcriptional LysR family regulator